jgi:hypothetical protein
VVNNSSVIPKASLYLGFLMETNLKSNLFLSKKSIIASCGLLKPMSSNIEISAQYIPNYDYISLSAPLGLESVSLIQKRLLMQGAFAQKETRNAKDFSLSKCMDALGLAIPFKTLDGVGRKVGTTKLFPVFNIKNVLEYKKKIKN